MSTLAVPGSPRRSDAVAHQRVEAFGGLDVVHATYVDHAFSPHLHEFYAIGVITRGANTLACRGITHVVREGQMVVIEPGEIHTGEPAGPSGWTYRMIYPDAATARAAVGDRATPHLRETVITSRALALRFVRLHRVLQTSDCRLEQETRVLDVLRDLFATHGEETPTDDEPARDHRAVGIVREYLHAHYNQQVRLATLAELTGLSPFHLIRVFRSRVGLPPYSYLEQVRVARAQTLLCQGHPVSRVAFATGFSDQSHLTRHFKRVVGMTPGQYRRGARRPQDDSSAN
jgi:AraC-like DNA-binding protein